MRMTTSKLRRQLARRSSSHGHLHLLPAPIDTEHLVPMTMASRNDRRLSRRSRAGRLSLSHSRKQQQRSDPKHLVNNCSCQNHSPCSLCVFIPLAYIPKVLAQPAALRQGLGPERVSARVFHGWLSLPGSPPRRLGRGLGSPLLA